MPTLHFDPQRRIFAATERQLKQLETAGFLISISIFVPTCLNALSELASQNGFQPTPLLFTNTLVAGIGLVLSFFFALMWRKANKIKKDILNEIREQPCFQLNLDILEKDSASNSPTTSAVHNLKDKTDNTIVTDAQQSTGKQ